MDTFFLNKQMAQKIQEGKTFFYLKKEEAKTSEKRNR